MFIFIFGLTAVSFQVSASSNSNELSMIPVEGKLSLNDLGKAVTHQL